MAESFLTPVSQGRFFTLPIDRMLIWTYSSIKRIQRFEGTNGMVGAMHQSVGVESKKTKIKMALRRIKDQYSKANIKYEFTSKGTWVVNVSVV